MKRIALILVLIMLLGAMVASAEITRGKDSFTGGVTVNAYSSAGDSSKLKALYFTKIIETEPVEYELQATRISFRDFILQNMPVEIKIDSHDTQRLKVKEASSMPLVNDSEVYSDVTVTIPIDLISQINGSNRIALRFQTASGSYIYVLPDAVLAEWKEVIAAEK